MNDLIVGIGLVFVFEGLLWAIAPHLTVRMIAFAVQNGMASLRLAGLASAAIGVAIVWAIRG